MMIADITRRMIAFSEGNLPDINHCMMVWAYARTIGLEEGLDDRTQSILEIAALVHDIPRLPAALTHIEGMDYQILIEADYLVNAIENRWNRDNVTNFVSRYFRTQAGMGIAKDLFNV